jgi:hypothetical protein
MTLRRWDWFEQPGVSGYLATFITGLTLAVSVEFVAVHILERWQYTAAMPTVPGLEVGVVPIAQMLLLPPVIFRTAALWASSKK